MKRQKLYWLSWYEKSEDYRPLGYPPNEAIIGWWCTGHGEGGATIVAMVRAENEAAAKDAVEIDWPGVGEWRFFSETDANAPSDRFPLKDWMAKRLEACR